jgi:cytochrome P450
MVTDSMTPMRGGLADSKPIKQWSEGKLQMFNPQRTLDQEAILASCNAALSGYFAEVIQKRRKERRADLISSLIDAEEDGEQLDETEIINVCHSLLFAGNVTTTDLIGNAVLALLQHPCELSKLLAEPNLVRSAVEEVLRYDSPVMQGARIATKVMQIGGFPVAAGQTINAMLYAANHDPESHPDPKRFDIERPDKRHNSFGVGAHFCLGAPLARAEAQIAVSMLFEHFPKLRLRTERPVERRAMLNFNGLESLWVRAD